MTYPSKKTWQYYLATCILAAVVIPIMIFPFAVIYAKAGFVLGTTLIVAAGLVTTVVCWALSVLERY